MFVNIYWEHKPERGHTKLLVSKSKQFCLAAAMCCCFYILPPLFLRKCRFKLIARGILRHLICPNLCSTIPEEAFQVIESFLKAIRYTIIWASFVAAAANNMVFGQFSSISLQSKGNRNLTLATKTCTFGVTHLLSVEMWSSHLQCLASHGFVEMSHEWRLI